MTKRIIDLGNETDWYFDGGRRLFALNRDTNLFENTSWTQGLTMLLYDWNDDEDCFDEGDVSLALNDRLLNGDEYEFTLYNSQHQLVGFVFKNE